MTRPVPTRAARHEAWMRRALALATDAAGVLTHAVASPPRPYPVGPDANGQAHDDTALMLDDSSSTPLSSGDGDVPIGAVVYGPDGVELAAARNQRELTGDPSAHAEILALRQAARLRGHWRLDGCALVVTVEPCTMCAGALVAARIATVVFGAWEPKTGAVGSLWDVVRDPRLAHRPEVYSGVLAADCAAVVRDFFLRHRLVT